MLIGLDKEQTSKALTLMKQIIIDAYANQNSNPFINLPSRRHYKDYFLTIAHPMALSIVKQKIKKYELIADMKSDLRLISSNCSQYNQPKSEIVKMSRDLINSIMESWIDSGLQKLMKQQDRAVMRENRASKKTTNMTPSTNLKDQEEKQAVAMLNQNKDGFRTIPIKRRYFKLEEYKEFKIYSELPQSEQEESNEVFCDLVERVFSLSCSLSPDKYVKFLKFLVKSGFTSNFSDEDINFDITADILTMEDLDKINEQIRMLKSDK